MISISTAAQYIHRLADDMQRRSPKISEHAQNRLWALLDTNPKVREAFNRPPHLLLIETAEHLMPHELHAIADELTGQPAPPDEPYSPQVYEENTVLADIKPQKVTPKRRIKHDKIHTRHNAYR